MGPPQGPYILQLCMGPSYFGGGLTPPDPPYFAHCFSDFGKLTSSKLSHTTYGLVSNRTFAIPAHISSKCPLNEISRKPKNLYRFRAKSQIISAGSVERVKKLNVSRVKRATFFNQRFISAWNSLPENAVHSSSLSRLKHLILKIEFSGFLKRF